ncbi:hypothetical protein DL765_006980 [Monosporascus sp. GIB2]|nr:hypothetical protein DL765_006980 [Monosporascus sp. GIB2]
MLALLRFTSEKLVAAGASPHLVRIRICVTLVPPDEGDDDAPKTPSQGAACLLAAALYPALVDSNHAGGRAFMQDCRVAETAMDYAPEPGNAARLWEPSERLVGRGFGL